MESLNAWVSPLLSHHMFSSQRLRCGLRLLRFERTFPLLRSWLGGWLYHNILFFSILWFSSFFLRCTYLLNRWNGPKIALKPDPFSLLGYDFLSDICGHTWVGWVAYLDMQLLGTYSYTKCSLTAPPFHWGSKSINEALVPPMDTRFDPAPLYPPRFAITT